ncbi:hypothetical protein GQ53DRAFT_646441 [Thozetella sp. PMI_491]|nr:hypothetical protein GQ53DRAFT_646441 [Thozetella sp. PMI_491]
MPFDHFNSSDMRMFNNRFFVNDTYHVPGGPVILFDFGENGITAETAAEHLAGASGVTSAPLELAKALNGLVIGWEHRYYGDSSPPGSFVANGSSYFQFLTVEQALEDVVYFAHHFNTTQLSNNAVRNGPNDTALLGPSDTPWIFVGGSYPGDRAAWIRVRNPETIFASWASSAPVQLGPDGAAYFNSIYRALPKNCTSDIQAATKYVEAAFESDDSDSNLELRIAAVPASAVTGLLFNRDLISVQNSGYSEMLQIFCDSMESFNYSQYLFDSATGDSNVTSSTVGSASSTKSWLPHPGSDSNNDDGTSWAWQVVSELGRDLHFNSSSKLVLGPSVPDYSSSHAALINRFTSVHPTDNVPKSPDGSYANSLGGWNMKPSNTLFTNGEFDPWRAFGVMSPEQDDLGAPQRTISQEIPPCNTEQDEIFGLLFAGAVHIEDMAFFPNARRGSAETEYPPVLQASDLFVKAYKEWLPCFYQPEQAAQVKAP